MQKNLHLQEQPKLCKKRHGSMIITCMARLILFVSETFQDFIETFVSYSIKHGKMGKKSWLILILWETQLWLWTTCTKPAWFDVRKLHQFLPKACSESCNICYPVLKPRRVWILPENFEELTVEGVMGNKRTLVAALSL